jgi:hypothetical protein
MAEEETIAVTTDIAILVKGQLLAVVAMAAHKNGGAVMKVDPRKDQPEILMYRNFFKTIEVFEKVLKKSEEKGWRVVHQGAPNYG